MLAELSDEDRFREIMEGATTLEPKGEETWGGVEVRIVEDEENPGEEFAYAVTDGYVLLGDPEGVKLVLEAEGDSLADTDRYKDATATVGTRLGSFVYFDFHVLFDVFGGDEYVSEDDFNLEALQALLFTMVEDGGFTRAAGAVTIDD
jgi:hypothetical protein